MTVAEAATTDSYYGEQGLHYLDIKGESCFVPRGKDFILSLCRPSLSFLQEDIPSAFFSAKNGPIYSVQWNPNSTDFCVVYGCILVAIIYFLKLIHSLLILCQTSLCYFLDFLQPCLPKPHSTTWSVSRYLILAQVHAMLFTTTHLEIISFLSLCLLLFQENHLHECVHIIRFMSHSPSCIAVTSFLTMMQVALKFIWKIYQDFPMNTSI